MKFGWRLKGVMHGYQERGLPDCLEHLQRHVKGSAIMISNNSKDAEFFKKECLCVDEIPVAPSLCALLFSSSAQCLPSSTPAAKLDWLEALSRIRAFIV